MAEQINWKSKVIRALTWKQPFAELMLHGKIETRTRRTNVRGWVLICAGKIPYTEGDLINISGEAGAQRILVKLNTEGIKERKGQAIGIGWLADCRRMTPSDEAKTFVKFKIEQVRYCWVFENVQPIEPFEWSGSQGWTILTDEQKDKIKVLTHTS